MSHRLTRPRFLLGLQDAVLRWPFVIVILLWLAVYGVIGFAFGLLYWDFSTLLKNATSFGDALSFSFVTQATIGYGDVLPGGWLRAATNLQAVIGTGLNGAAIGMLTLRILTRSPPIRVPASVAIRHRDVGRSALWFRYLNVDSRALVDVTVTVFYITAARDTESYDVVGGEIGAMHLETVDPWLTMALFIDFADRPVPIHDLEGEAIKNDRKIPFHPNMFGSEERQTRLLFRVRGYLAATGDMFAFAHTYRPPDIQCAGFSPIDNTQLFDLPEANQMSARRTLVKEAFNRLLPARHERCGACTPLPACPFRH